MLKEERGRELGEPPGISAFGSFPGASLEMLAWHPLSLLPHLPGHCNIWRGKEHSVVLGEQPESWEPWNISRERPAVGAGPGWWGHS